MGQQPTARHTSPGERISGAGTQPAAANLPTILRLLDIEDLERKGEALEPAHVRVARR